MTVSGIDNLRRCLPGGLLVLGARPQHEVSDSLLPLW